MASEIPQKIIDLDKVIAESGSAFLKRLPRFVVGILKKIIRQEDINQIVHRNRDKYEMAFVEAILNDLEIKVVLEGTENIPKEGRFVFVANHPLGAIDSLAFLKAIHQHFPHVVSPSNKLFEYVPNLGSLIVGLNVYSTNTKDAIVKLNDAFESDAQIMIFPAGEVSRKVNGKVEDPIWQKTFVSKAIQHQRDIIPVWISGRNSALFYGTHYWRKLFGIKMFIESILLPDEMFKNRKSKIVLRFGKPILRKSLEELPAAQWAEKIKSMVYLMGDPN